MLEGLGEAGDLRGGVELLEELPDDRLAGLGEANELIGITILMPATKPERELIVSDWDEPAPILGKDGLGLDSLLRELLREVFREPFAPDSGVNVAFLSVIWGKLG